MSVGFLDSTEVRIGLRGPLAYSKRRSGCPLCTLHLGGGAASSGRFWCNARHFQPKRFGHAAGAVCGQREGLIQLLGQGHQQVVRSLCSWSHDEGFSVCRLSASCVAISMASPLTELSNTAQRSARGRYRELKLFGLRPKRRRTVSASTSWPPIATRSLTRRIANKAFGSEK